MDQEIRNKLRNVVTQCRKLLEDSVSQELEGKYAIFARKDQVTADLNAKMTHLTEEEQAARKDILDHFGHIKARGFKPKEALDQLIREIAFTHLNRLCAYKMMEAREVYVGGQKFREAVSRGINSNGVKFYLADHPEEERLFNTGHQDVAYRHFLDWLGGLLSDEIGVLFNPNDPANRLYPRQKTLDEVLDLLNDGGIKADEPELRKQWAKIWSQDETIGWVYQYFTPKEMRDQVRKESSAPRNSYELAFRNQFFTPRYVVEFLTDNTLGRTWYEMLKGDTKLKDQCHYMVRRPNEIFLAGGQSPPKPTQNQDDVSHEELLKQPVHIPHRPEKDPRELRILDPACGSGHFLLYCFALLLTIYEEAYADPDLGSTLKEDYPTLEALRRDVPRLILAHNLHGIDIDLRATQIAALALWLRCQRAYQALGLKQDRPKITKSNIVCAERMPGEREILDEFLETFKKDRLEDLIGRVTQVPEGSRVRATESMVASLNELVRLVWDKMQLAGEAGSLLKIEEELQEAIRTGQEEWEEQRPLFTEFNLTEKPKESYVRCVPGEGVSFWQRAEALVLEALRDYARHATGGERVQRQLFAEDVVQGFAFIDICQKRFDVVLMNPPFGSAIATSKPYLAHRYPDWGNELYVAFGRRAIELGAPSGAVGAITSRLGFFLSSFASWRQELVLPTMQIGAFADLGYGVLDEALVEVAAWALTRPRCNGLLSSFLSVLDSKDKAPALADSFNRSVTHVAPSNLFAVDQHSFSLLSGSPFCYWISDSIRKKIGLHKTLIEWGADARKGLNSSDDERFLRAAWEVAPSSIGRKGRWVYLAKGGEYTPFYDDIHLVIDWSGDGSVLASTGADIRNPSFYFKSGLTYSSRSTSAFNIKFLPKDCIFSTGGHGLFADSEDSLLVALALLSCRPIGLQIEMAVGSGDEAHSGSAARNYLNGTVNALCLPTVPSITRSELKALSRSLLDEARQRTTLEETSRLFVLSPLPLTRQNSLVDCCEAIAREEEDRDLKLIAAYTMADTIASREFGLTTSELEDLDRELGKHVGDLPSNVTLNPDEIKECFTVDIQELIRKATNALGNARFLTKKAFVSSRRLELTARMLECNPRKIIEARRSAHALVQGDVRLHVDSLLSYAIGCVFGRWDSRLATEKRGLPTLPEPFAVLPSCSPGMLTGSNGLPAMVAPEGYPHRIMWDGIISDDPDHSDDIVRRVREILELIWKDRAESIEKEACEILEVKELRDYFRKPGNGGFWFDHVSRYSKSRRKAPIYWLLQSSRKNYAIWLYYHRLDNDLLFKALVNYVEPKIRLEASRLEALRSQKVAAGESGNEAKRLAKEVERQEDFLSELQDFDDKLRRAANLHLEPDLNDGVVLNIASLHELVPWKEAKSYWEELLKGEYEWSSIGKQLRQKGLVK